MPPPYVVCLFHPIVKLRQCVFSTKKTSEPGYQLLGPIKPPWYWAVDCYVGRGERPF